MRPKRAKGFSLLEMIAVVMILGILAVLVIARLGQSTAQAKQSVSDQYRADINAALERYNFDHGVFPSSLNDLHPDYYPDTLPVDPVTNQPYQLDTTINRVK